MEKEHLIKPIGIFRSPFKNFLEAPRQATQNVPESYIELFRGHQYETALSDLEGFDRIWVIFSFHLKNEWRPLVQPPRGSEKKRGVFATRSPLRPNNLGLSCLKIEKIDGLKIYVTGSDLLDETPIFDIKPYLAYADSFPDSKAGWLEGVEKERWEISWSPKAREQSSWLAKNGIFVEPIVKNQLEFDPTNSERKRVYPSDENWMFAYRTWRIMFSVAADRRCLQIIQILSGYSKEDLKSADDKYGDKKIHTEFNKVPAYFPHNGASNAPLCGK